MRLYNNLKRIYEKSKTEGILDVYRPMLEKFVTLLIYEDTYLLQKQAPYLVLKKSGEDMFIDCGGFGIIVDKADKISIHT